MYVNISLSNRKQKAEVSGTVDYADLEVLDISKIDHPEAKFALAKQVLSFINKNG